MKSKNTLRSGIMSFTNNLGRARHSARRARAPSRQVRAVGCPTTRQAGRGLPALPVLPSLFVKGKNSVRSFGFWPLISALRPPTSAFCKIICAFVPGIPHWLTMGQTGSRIEREKR